MIISMEEEQKTLEYQKIWNKMSKILPKIKNILRPIYEVVDVSFFEETNLFPGAFLDLCKNKSKSTSVSTIWSQSSLENNGYGTRSICTNGHD